MHRREVLSLISTAGLCTVGGGCLSNDNGDSHSDKNDSVSSSSPPDAPDNSAQIVSQSPSSNPDATEQQRRHQLSIGETAYLSTGTVSVNNLTIRGSVIYSNNVFYSLMGSGEPTQQFIVVGIEGTFEVDTTEFAFRRNGRVIDPNPRPQEIVSITRNCSTPCIGIPVDTRAADTAAVVYQPSYSSSDSVRAAWNLDENTLKLLSIQPNCQLQKAEITNFDNKLALELTVANVSPRDAGFRALIKPDYASDVSEPVGFLVPEGQTVTRTIVPSEIQVYDTEEATFTRPINEDTRFFTIGREN